MLNRLYKAADLDNNENNYHVRFANENVDENGVIDKQNQALINQAMANKKKVSHEEWIRSKEHQKTLREVLIQEAKRDTYEKLLVKQAEQDAINQRRRNKMHDWEQNKEVQQALDKEQKLR